MQVTLETCGASSLIRPLMQILEIVEDDIVDLLGDASLKRLDEFGERPYGVELARGMSGRGG